MDTSAQASKSFNPADGGAERERDPVYAAPIPAGKILLLPIAALTALSVLALPSAAPAEVTLGQVAPANPPAGCGGKPADLVQVSTSAVPSPYVVPSAGLITSWSTSASAGAGQALTFKVFRPVAGSSYSVVGHDGPRPLAPSILNSFPVGIAVRAGDVIGLNDSSAATAPNACDFPTGSSADVFGAAKFDSADGATVFLPPIGAAYRVNVAATLQQAPTIAAVRPAKGSIKGGFEVAISGSDFSAATAVSFGSVPATSFTVVSPTQIAALAPAARKPGRVDVTVTTSLGTTPVVAGDRFTYSACVVPKLSGRSLRAARKKLKQAGCALGKARGEKSKTAEVVKQSPKTGKVLAPGARVSVKLAG
jgi:hypothetical protein